MKFIKVNPQLALPVDKIGALAVGGRENAANLNVSMVSGESYILAYFKDFRSAELALLDLVDTLEGETA